MKNVILAAVCGLLLASAASAQTGPTCLTAGRLSPDGRWAPRMPGVELLGADGRSVRSADKSALGGVRQVRVTAPALLSRCDGDAQLALGPDTPGPKAQVPALSAGVLAVEGVGYPKLRRGGELVELRVSAPPERVTLVSR